MQSRKIRKPVSEINVVPYIDVMLVLLVIFMITTPLLTQGVKVELPQAQAETIEAQEQEPIIVSVNEQGEYFLNISEQPNKAMSGEQLATRVAAEIQLAKMAQQTRPVLVKGDNSVNYGKVVQAMVLLQKAGAKSVGLMTKPAEPLPDLADRLKPQHLRG